MNFNREDGILPVYFVITPHPELPTTIVKKFTSSNVGRRWLKKNIKEIVSKNRKDYEPFPPRSMRTICPNSGNFCQGTRLLSDSRTRNSSRPL